MGISLLYQILDLTSTPKGNGFLFQKHIPAIYLLGVDTLGFACFLALLIANGIIVAETCATPLYIYNSVPWILLWYVLFFFGLFFLSAPFLPPPPRLCHLQPTKKTKKTLTRVLNSVIHGRIALSAFVLALRDLINMGASGAASEGYCCAECKKRASGKSTDQDDDAQAEAQAEAESAPLLTPQSGRSAGDVEAGLV